MKYVSVAAIQFQTAARPDALDARDIVLGETKSALDSVRGLGLDLVVTCEGVEAYGQKLDQAETLSAPGPFLAAYAEFATDESCHVAGSVKLREGDIVYNSIAYIGPDGQPLGAYHKTFLTHGELDEGLAPGPGAQVVESDLGRLGGLICFDLNFERLRHQYRALKPDILTFASMYHGGHMQDMWAHDCRAFFVSALPITGCGIRDPLGTPVRLTDNYNPVARARIRSMSK